VKDKLLGGRGRRVIIATSCLSSRNLCFSCLVGCSACRVGFVSPLLLAVVMFVLGVLLYWLVACLLLAWAFRRADVVIEVWLGMNTAVQACSTHSPHDSSRGTTHILSPRKAQRFHHDFGAELWARAKIGIATTQTGVLWSLYYIFVVCESVSN
jgi:hypothetical protein